LTSVSGSRGIFEARKPLIYSRFPRCKEAPSFSTTQVVENEGERKPRFSLSVLIVARMAMNQRLPGNGSRAVAEVRSTWCPATRNEAEQSI
jgi:hypothetical protein